MEKDRQQDIVYSNKMRAGKRRTYFFDIRKTKGEDFYVSITESTKKFNGDGFERHKIFIYKEDSFAKREEENGEGFTEKKEDDLSW